MLRHIEEMSLQEAVQEELQSSQVLSDDAKLEEGATPRKRRRTKTNEGTEHGGQVERRGVEAEGTSSRGCERRPSIRDCHPSAGWQNSGSAAGQEGREPKQLSPTKQAHSPQKSSVSPTTKQKHSTHRSPKNKLGDEEGPDQQSHALDCKMLKFVAEQMNNAWNEAFKEAASRELRAEMSWQRWNRVDRKRMK